MLLPLHRGVNSGPTPLVSDGASAHRCLGVLVAETERNVHVRRLLLHGALQIADAQLGRAGLHSGSHLHSTEDLNDHPIQRAMSVVAL